MSSDHTLGHIFYYTKFPLKFLLKTQKFFKNFFRQKRTAAQQRGSPDKNGLDHFFFCFPAPNRIYTMDAIASM